jgi:CRP-like cAMP-binding protein
VRDYKDFVWGFSGGGSTSRDEFLGSLSVALKSEVCLHLHGNAVRHIPFLYLPECPEALVNVVQMLHSEVSRRALFLIIPRHHTSPLGRVQFYLAGDVVIHERERTTLSSRFYLVNMGCCRVYQKKDYVKSLAWLHEGEYFGEMAYLFIGTRGRTATIGAFNNALLSSLSFRELDSLVQDFPELSASVSREMMKHMHTLGAEQRAKVLMHNKSKLKDQKTSGIVMSESVLERKISKLVTDSTSSPASVSPAPVGSPVGSPSGGSSRSLNKTLPANLTRVQSIRERAKLIKEQISDIKSQIAEMNTRRDAEGDAAEDTSTSGLQQQQYALEAIVRNLFREEMKLAGKDLGKPATNGGTKPAFLPAVGAVS